MNMGQRDKPLSVVGKFFGKFATKLIFVLDFLQMLLDPVETANDAIEAKLTFLAVYARLFADENNILDTNIATVINDWRFKKPPDEMLSTYLRRKP